MLNNLRVVFKIGLIAVFVGVVMLGLVAYMASGMSALDTAYSDLVRRVDSSAMLAIRVARKAETYRQAAFELLTEITDAGNARLLKVTQDMSAEVMEGLAKIKTDLPEKATEVAQRSADFT
jgi:methyl-accepting chemotaxis protein